MSKPIPGKGNRLRVLLVCRSFPVHRAGGMEWHAQDILEGLLQRGHEVHVLTSPLPDTPALKPLEPNGTLTAVGGSRSGRYDVAFLREAPTVAADICQRFRIDLIHAQGFAGLSLVLRGSGLPPVVTTIHGTLFSETPLDRRIRCTRSPVQRLADAWNYKHRLGFLPLWKRFLKKRPQLIVDSEFTRKELIREESGLRPHIVPLGIDLGRFRIESRSGFDPETGTLVDEPSASRPVLLFAIGRLEKLKGFDVLLQALARRRSPKPWHLAIAGDGPERARLEMLAMSLGMSERVTFTGRIPDSELARWFCAADVYLNADQGHPAFGLTQVEALVCGTPVIASRVGAHPEVVGTGDGVLVPTGKIDAWAHEITDTLARLPESGSARERRARNARRRFSRERMIDDLERIYEDVRGFA